MSLRECNLNGLNYCFTSDLLSLEQERPITPHLSGSNLTVITTPSILNQWRQSLEQFLDQHLAHYLLQGLTNGFHIGYQYSTNHTSTPLRRKQNMRSADQHPTVVQMYLESEQSAGRIIGPLKGATQEMTHISPFGVIPKHHQPGKWSLILDLSSPRGNSINDNIDADLCSVRYADIDQAIVLVSELEPGCQLAKLDLQSAYRIVPVHPDDRPLLGMYWRSSVYADAALPFRLRSAPKIFPILADTLLWIMLQDSVTHAIHYLDDFLVAGSTSKNVSC